MATKAKPTTKARRAERILIHASISTTPSTAAWPDVRRVLREALDEGRVTVERRPGGYEVTVP